MEERDGGIQVADDQRPAVSRAQYLQGLIEQKRAAIEQVCDRIGVDRLIKLTQLACSRNPKLLECSPASLLTSIMDAARLGLDPSGTMNSAYLVPYYNKEISGYECQLIPGYGGLIDLVCRGGKVRNVESRIVYRGDEFDVQYGTEPKIIHRPSFETERRDQDITHAYAVFHFRDGGCQFEVMDRRSIDAIAGSKPGPWKYHYAEMARKCPIRRAVKTLSIDIDDALAHAVELNDRAENESAAHVAQAETTKESNLNARLGGSN